MKKYEISADNRHIPSTTYIHRRKWEWVHGGRHGRIGLDSLLRRLPSLFLLAVWPAAAVDIANMPMVLPTPAKPNVVFTLKLPGMSYYATPPYMAMGMNLARASYHINPIAYNPHIVYREPPGYEGSVTFDAARIYGYITSPTDYVSITCNGVTPPDTSAAPFCYGGPMLPNQVDLNNNYCLTEYLSPTTTSGAVLFFGIATETRAGPTCDDNGAYYSEFDVSKSVGGVGCTFPEHAENAECYKKIYIKTLDAAQKKNYAVWYSFYRTRELATRTAILLAMPRLEGKIRLAWQGDHGKTIPSDSCVLDSAGVCKYYDLMTYSVEAVDNRLREFVDIHSHEFYKWIKGAIGYTGSTNYALIRAAKYLGMKENYRDDPSDDSSILRSCRDNIHLVVGDAHSGHIEIPSIPYNYLDVGAAPLPGDADSVTYAKGGSAGGGYKWAIDYTPRTPYMDRPYPASAVPEKDNFTERNCTSDCQNINSLADLAMYYWAVDIAPDEDVPNTLVPSIVDKSGNETKQTWNPKNNPATWQNLMQFMVITGAQGQFLSQHGSDWATDMYDGKPAKGMKNWHKYDNGHALAYDHWHAALNSRGVFYPVDRIDEIIDAIDKIANRIERRLAASASIAANSTRLDTGTTVYQAKYTAVEWSGELIANRLHLDGSLGEEIWRASMPAAGERKLVTHNGVTAVNFDTTALLPTDWADQVGVVGASPAEVLAWLRGDQSQEQVFDADGNVISGKFRRRTSLLGDIVNSDPVYVGHQDYGYAVLPEGASDAYKNFVTANKNRVKMLYVGANDGMLHGFVAGSGTGAEHACGTTLGREVFAYIPKAAREQMPTLANPAYGQHGGIPHRYYVDGPASVGDAYLGGAWKTILLGTTGAGGRSIFALDVTNPCDFGTGKVLWERDSTSDADIGYTMAKPIIARLNNGQWAAVFGNGYNSASGKAVLFVVDLANGTLIKKFDVGGTDNGLAAPSLYDADGNGTTDYIYAGDLQGRMWKFDVSGASEATWGVAFGGAPLFTAVGPGGHPQPITAAPELGTPPGGTSGVMVYFGTGRFFATGDEVDKKVQSLYGLLDNGSAIAGRTDLVAQSITAEEAIGGKTVRKTSITPVSYPTKRGWYLDLDYGGAKGERVISTPRRLFGRVFFTTLIPEADPCKFGGTSWLMELEPGTGAMPETSIIDVGGEVVAGIMSTVGIVKSFDFLSGEGAVAIGLGSTGTTEAIRLNPPGSSPRVGRISWREIID